MTQKELGRFGFHAYLPGRTMAPGSPKQLLIRQRKTANWQPGTFADFSQLAARAVICQIPRERSI
jgi:hypothetical protein